jgi:hypothetical protein
MGMKKLAKRAAVHGGKQTGWNISYFFKYCSVLSLMDDKAKDQKMLQQ